MIAGAVLFIVALCLMFIAGYGAGYKDRSRSAQRDRLIWDMQRKDMIACIDRYVADETRRRTTIVEGDARA